MQMLGSKFSVEKIFKYSQKNMTNVFCILIFNDKDFSRFLHFEND